MKHHNNVREQLAGLRPLSGEASDLEAYLEKVELALIEHILIYRVDDQHWEGESEAIRLFKKAVGVGA